MALQIPASEREWKDVAQQFERRWNSPNCIGAIDGMQINIRKPSGSYYFNYKNSFSVVLMAVPDDLPNCEIKQPYVFVADDAFPLMDNLMKPFSRKNLTREQAISDYRLSRARRIVENAFGILASRFRILLR
ncbi:hypothetical protein JTB14_016804 [Gonioctena quinquepunctata]|nr:hypothetical protein JTB14_016804 [Gonioctena quinquepunctata]